MRIQRHMAAALAAFLGIAAFSYAGTAKCAEPGADAPSRIEGDLDKWPKVTLSLEDATAGQALAEIAGRLGLGYVAAKETADAPRLAISLKDKPGREALDAVLEIASMRVKIRGGVLVATPDTPVVEDPAPAAGDLSALPPVPVEAVTPPSPSPAPPDSPIPDDRAGHRDRNHRGGKGGENVQFGVPVRIEAGEEVDEAVAIGGPLTVAGRVRGDAVAIGGGVTLEPTAEVEGNLVSVGGHVDVQPGAVVRGDRVRIGGPIPKVFGAFAAGIAGHEIPAWQLALFSGVAAFVKCVVLLLIGLLVITFMPDRYARVREQLTTRPGRSALAGLIMFLALVPMFILLAVTVVGIPLIPIAIIILVVLMSLGMTAFISWLGDRLPILKGRKSQFVAMALGTAVVFLAMLVPVIGWMLLAAAAFTSAGAALLSRAGSPPREARTSDPQQI